MEQCNLSPLLPLREEVFALLFLHPVYVPHPISEWPSRPLSHSKYPGYKSGRKTPVQHQFSLELARCTNSVSHSINFTSLSVSCLEILFQPPRTTTPPFWDAAVLIRPVWNCGCCPVPEGSGEERQKKPISLMVLTDCCTNLETPLVPAAISKQQTIQASVM